VSQSTSSFQNQPAPSQRASHQLKNEVKINSGDRAESQNQEAKRRPSDVLSNIGSAQKQGIKPGMVSGPNSRGVRTFENASSYPVAMPISLNDGDSPQDL